MKCKNFIVAIALLAGTIIGAGIFSLPYVFKVVGFWVGVLCLVLFTGVYTVIHLMYAAVIKRH